jgi:hypothetical protein
MFILSGISLAISCAMHSLRHVQCRSACWYSAALAAMLCSSLRLHALATGNKPGRTVSRRSTRLTDQFL